MSGQEDIHESALSPADNRAAQILAWMRTRQGQALGALCAALLLVAYCAIQVSPFLSDRWNGVSFGIPGFAAQQYDYKHLYLGSKLLAEGISPYHSETLLTFSSSYEKSVDIRFKRINPYVYLPFTGLVIYPLTLLPFAQSAIVFGFINHACIIGGLFLAAIACGWRRDFWTLSMVLLMVSFNHAVFRQNMAGQLSGVLLFGFCVLYTGLLRKWHPAAIGFIAAFLMLFKLSPGIFLIWFLWRREWNRALWMIGSATLLMLITVGVFGLQSHLDFIPVLRDMSYGHSTWPEHENTFWRDSYNESFNALFHRMFVENQRSEIKPVASLSEGVANGMTWIVSLGLLAWFFAAVWRGNSKTESPRALAGSFAMAVCISLLIPSIMWDHYLTQLLLPILLIFIYGWRRPTMLVLAIVALILVCLRIQFEDSFYLKQPMVILGNLKLIPVLLCLWAGRQFLREKPELP